MLGRCKFDTKLKGATLSYNRVNLLMKKNAAKKQRRTDLLVSIVFNQDCLSQLIA